MKRARHVEVFPARNGRWYFRDVAGNGSRGERSTKDYVSKWSARRGAARAHPGLEVVDA